MSEQESGAYYGIAGPAPTTEPGPSQGSGLGGYPGPPPRTQQPSDPYARPDPAGPALFPPPDGVQQIQPRDIYTTREITSYPVAPAAPLTGPGRTARPTMVAVVVLIALLVGGAAGVGGTLATRALAPPSASAAEAATLDTVAIAKLVLPSTVTIRARSGGSGSTGSGFVIDAAQGYILTNNHVVAVAADGGDVRIERNDGRSEDAKIVGRSPTYDLAVIKIEPVDDLPAVQLGVSDDTEVGEPVIAVGSPLGLGGTVTEGIVSAKHRPVAVGETRGDPDANIAYIDAIQTDAAINPGNSGGPLVDTHGRVIGINSAILTLGGSTGGSSGNIGLGFSIPIDQAKTISQQLIDSGFATYPTLGATLADSQVTDGVRIGAVTPSGPAATSGLEGGDVITKIGEKQVSSAVQLIVDVRTHRPGEKVAFTYVRDSQEAKVTVTLGEKRG